MPDSKQNMPRLLLHQIVGADWLRGRQRAYLADSPGFGKTRTLLAGLPAGTNIGIICPAIVIPHWHHEAAAVGHAPDLLTAFSYQGVIQPGNAGQARREELRYCDALILDEAHYLSNPEAQRTKLIFGKEGILRAHHQVFAASGTPMARNPSHLYATLRAMAPHLLAGVDTYMEWIEMTCRYDFRHIPGRPFTKPALHVFGARDAPALHALLTTPQQRYPPFMLRRTESDVGLGLPSLWWQWKRVGVNTVGIDALIQTLDDDTQWMLRNLPGQLQSSPQATALRQALGVAKAVAFIPQLTDELPEGSSLVLVAHHKAVMLILSDALLDARISFVQVDGSTSPEQRIKAIELFQSGQAQVFLGSIGAMQTGITLTAAHRIVIIEPGWTGDANVQVVKRIHRIGQTHPCRAELLIAAGTIEEAVMAQVEAEIAMMEQVIDGGTRAMRDTHTGFTAL